MSHPLFPSARLMLLVGIGVLTCAPATAAALHEREVALLAGAKGDYERGGVSLRLGPLWSAQHGSWHLALRPELELSRIRYTGPLVGPDSLTQGGALGRLHIHYGEGRLRPYMELGLGLSLFSRDHIGSKDFSTHFQFSEHVALGLELGQHGFAGLQFAHYSNADIDEPNDGIDLYQLVVGVPF